MDAFPIDCECGASIQVTLRQAGGDVLCPECGKQKELPSLSALRKLAAWEAPMKPNEFSGFAEFDSRSSNACIMATIAAIFLLLMCFGQKPIFQNLLTAIFLSAYLAIPFLIYRRQMNAGGIGFFHQLIFLAMTGILPGVMLALFWDLIRSIVFRFSKSDGIINYSTNTVGVLPFARP